MPMDLKTIKTVFLEEPSLEFRYGQPIIDPHHGLELFGPYDTDLPSHPASIPYAVIGTQEGVAAFQGWSVAMMRPTVSVESEEAAALWPPFPGFEAAFQCSFAANPAWALQLDAALVEKATLNRDPDKRAFKVAEHYVDGIETAAKRDEPIALVICVVPDEVWLRCRPQSTVSKGIGQRLSKKERQMRKLGQSHLFDVFEPDQYLYSVDFRRQLKARAMNYNLPTQIIRESTLRLSDEVSLGERGLTPLSDRMWNLSTAVYYKAGGKPWRLASARDGVCYVGVAFKKTDDAVKSRTACCAAQMFLDSGDGIVFMGESGPWYSPEDRQCHLTKKAAESLLRGVLGTYRQLEGKELKEVFLHYRSSLNDEEFSGYVSACPAGTKVVGIRVRTERRGLRMFRQGKMPVIRGTSLTLDNRTAYLWSSGFKPSIGTYDGWETPAPLRIDIQHGYADIIEVANDIHGLTKLNYNACKIGDSEPVTIRFSDAVGGILVSNPGVTAPKPNFKFYI